MSPPHGEPLHDIPVRTDRTLRSIHSQVPRSGDAHAEPHKEAHIISVQTRRRPRQAHGGPGAGLRAAARVSRESWASFPLLPFQSAVDSSRSPQSAMRILLFWAPVKYSSMQTIRKSTAALEIASMMYDNISLFLFPPEAAQPFDRPRSARWPGSDSESFSKGPEPVEPQLDRSRRWCA
jgi:hypothetical protein